MRLSLNIVDALDLSEKMCCDTTALQFILDYFQFHSAINSL